MARILLVNDDRDLLELCAEVLAERGYEVDAAASEERAVQLAVDRRPDVLLLDLVVTNTSGERVLQSIQARTDHGPVVVMSASADGASRAWRMGAQWFLAKPFSEEELVAAVQNAARGGS